MEPEFILAALLLAGAGGGGLAFNARRSSKLVVRRFDVLRRPCRPEEAAVHLEGRVGGLRGLLLTLLGLSPTESFSVTPLLVQSEQSQLSGRRTEFIPVRNVSSVSGGSHRPIGYLFAAAAAGLLAAFATLGVLFQEASIGRGEVLSLAFVWAVAGLLLVAYRLNKTVDIAVQASGGASIRLRFYPNVLEGRPVDLELATEAVSVIRDLMTGRDGGRRVAAPPGGGWGDPVPEEYALGDGPSGDGFIDAGEIDEDEQFLPDDPPEADPIISTAPELSADEQADRLFADARRAVAAKDRATAVSHLRELVDRFPGTPAAGKARRTLARYDRPER